MELALMVVVSKECMGVKESIVKLFSILLKIYIYTIIIF